MKNKVLYLAFVAVAVVALSAASCEPPSGSGGAKLISHRYNNVQGVGASHFSSMSADGKFIVFTSSAANLFDDDTNGGEDVFLYEIGNGPAKLISISNSGHIGEPGSDSNAPSVSNDGRYVAFQSNTRNFALGDSNNTTDIFIRDTHANTTSIASMGAGGQPNGQSTIPKISGDGTMVAFNSEGSNIVSGDTNGHQDVFVRPRAGGTTVLVSGGLAGQPGNGTAWLGGISDDGNKVTFLSSSSNLVPGDTNGKNDVFVRDIAAGTTTLVSKATDGGPTAEENREPTISGDGTTVSFASTSPDLVLGDTNGVEDVFVVDLASGSTTRVSVSSDGTQGNSASGLRRFFEEAAPMSTDGRYVTYTSAATNLVPGDTGITIDAFVHDRQTGNTRRVSNGRNGAEADLGSYATDISDDGTKGTIDSYATNLIPLDINPDIDVYRWPA